MRPQRREPQLDHTTSCCVALDPAGNEAQRIEHEPDVTLTWRTLAGEHSRDGLGVDEQAITLRAIGAR